MKVRKIVLVVVSVAVVLAATVDAVAQTEYKGYGFAYWPLGYGGSWPLAYSTTTAQSIPLTVGDIPTTCMPYETSDLRPVVCDTQIKAVDVVHPIAVAIGVDMNATGDTAFKGVGLAAPASYKITSIIVRNCTHTQATAVGTIWTGAAGTGTQITTSQTPANVASTDSMPLTLNTGIATTDLTASTWYWNQTTSEGAAGTCDFWIRGYAYQ